MAEGDRVPADHAFRFVERGTDADGTMRQDAMDDLFVARAGERAVVAAVPFDAMPGVLVARGPGGEVEQRTGAAGEDFEDVGEGVMVGDRANGFAKGQRDLEGDLAEGCAGVHRPAASRRRSHPR